MAKPNEVGAVPERGDKRETSRRSTSRAHECALLSHAMNCCSASEQLLNVCLVKRGERDRSGLGALQSIFRSPHPRGPLIDHSKWAREEQNKKTENEVFFVQRSI